MGGEEEEEEGGGKWNPIRRRIQQHGLPPLPGSSSLLLLVLFLHSKKPTLLGLLALPSPSWCSIQAGVRPGVDCTYTREAMTVRPQKK